MIVSPYTISIYYFLSIYYCIGGPKNLFTPQIPYLTLGTPLLGGVILLKLFDPSYGFGGPGLIMPKKNS